MKYLLIVFFMFFGIAPSFSQNTYSYFENQDAVKGNRTVYTETIINASPEKAKAHFLRLDEWKEWNSVIVDISVNSGVISRIETQPTLNLTLDFSRKKDPSPAPLFPSVYHNNELLLVWGFKSWYLQADHVFVFEPIDGGKQTRFIHYERMTGLMSLFIMTKKTKSNMTSHYASMNEEFKHLCESVE